MSASKPYLTSVGSAPWQVASVLEWAEYLGATFGASGALDSLQYYERLGWITGSVRRQMVGYLQGLSVPELHHKKYDEPATLDAPLDALSGSAFGAHARSLEYIAAIAGDNLDEQLAALQVARGRVATQVGHGRAENRDRTAPTPSTAVADSD